MAENRRPRKVVRSRATIEGAGVHLRRAIGFGDPQLCEAHRLVRAHREEHARGTAARVQELQNGTFVRVRGSEG